VTVEEGAADELPERIRSGELHLAVDFQDAALPRREHDGTERRDLLREPFLVALPPEHALARKQSVRLRDLADEDWTAAYTDGLIVRACRAAGFEPRLVSITRDQLAIRGLITRGLAVTLAPRLLAEAFTGTVLRPIAGEGPERDVYALLPPGGRHPLAQPMLAALTQTAEELQGDLRS
jgi:DNA-binding transcriptional LysR family regulator